MHYDYPCVRGRQGLCAHPVRATDGTFTAINHELSFANMVVGDSLTNSPRGANLTYGGGPFDGFG
eukprot:7078575-Prymnesium_polylepis.1